LIFMLSFLLLCLVKQAFSDVPTFTLKNAAVSGLTMPAIGVGTGGYSFDPKGYGVYPECFSEDNGCGDYTVQAVASWLQVGGRRIDGANSYYSDRSIATAIQKSGVPRSEIFILSKIGPGEQQFPLGFNESIYQFAQVLSNLNTTYVDLLLIHWPTQVDPTAAISTDPACQKNTNTYSEKECRLSTWKGLVQIFNNGQAKAIGVSNYNITHLQEIIDAKLPLPSLNQCPFHLYRSSSHDALRNFCKTNNILFSGYSPLGVPDWWTYPGPKMASTPMKDSLVLQVAKAHNVTAAQVLLQWQYALGVPTNPRSQNADHMTENLQSYSFNLTSDEINSLLAAPQDYCSLDPTWYECAPDPSL